MKESGAVLFRRYYDERQTEKPRAVRLRHRPDAAPADGTYFVMGTAGEPVMLTAADRAGGPAGFTGSGDADGDARLLDPATEPARVRAMFVRADWTRRGLGRRILRACGTDVRREGFAKLSLMATLSGVGLYRAYGFVDVDEQEVTMPDSIAITCVSMEMPLPPAP